MLKGLTPGSEKYKETVEKGLDSTAKSLVENPKQLYKDKK